MSTKTIQTLGHGVSVSGQDTLADRLARMTTHERLAALGEWGGKAWAARWERETGRRAEPSDVDEFSAIYRCAFVVAFAKCGAVPLEPLPSVRAAREGLGLWARRNGLGFGALRAWWRARKMASNACRSLMYGGGAEGVFMLPADSDEAQPMIGARSMLATRADAFGYLGKGTFQPIHKARAVAHWLGSVSAYWQASGSERAKQGEETDRRVLSAIAAAEDEGLIALERAGLALSTERPDKRGRVRLVRDAGTRDAITRAVRHAIAGDALVSGDAPRALASVGLTREAVADMLDDARAWADAKVKTARALRVARQADQAWQLRAPLVAREVEIARASEDRALMQTSEQDQVRARVRALSTAARLCAAGDWDRAVALAASIAGDCEASDGARAWAAHLATRARRGLVRALIRAARRGSRGAARRAADTLRAMERRGLAARVTAHLRAETEAARLREAAMIAADREAEAQAVARAKAREAARSDAPARAESLRAIARGLAREMREREEREAVCEAARRRGAAEREAARREAADREEWLLSCARAAARDAAREAERRGDAYVLHV